MAGAVIIIGDGLRFVITRLTVHRVFAAKAHHDCATNLHPSRAGVDS